METTTPEQPRSDSREPRSDEATLYRQALDATRRIVARIGADQWTAPTPCPGWDVRLLVNHIVSGNLWAAELASGRTVADVGDRLDGDVVGADPQGAYDTSARLAAEAFEVSGALDAPCAVSYGPVPGAVYAGHRFLDVLVHGWDLAVATNQDAALDPVLVAACWDVVAPQLDTLRMSGVFGDDIEPGSHAEPRARLLAALGRRA